MEDPVSRAFFALAFKDAFRGKKPTEFGEFFSMVMERRYPTDFVRLRPAKTQGDRTARGYSPGRMLESAQSPVAGHEKLIDALAKVAHDSEFAKMIAKRAGFPPAHLPEFKTAFGFWGQVVEQSVNGMTNLERLVGEIAKQFPDNSELLAYGRRVNRTTASKHTRPSANRSVSALQVLPEPIADSGSPSAANENSIHAHGYLRSRRMIFQCYALDEIDDKTCGARIEADLEQTLQQLGQHFDTWVFVHNSTQGLSNHVLDKLLELEKRHEPLGVTQWGFEELRQQAMSLDDRELSSLLGPAPSRHGMTMLGLRDLVPVLDHIARLPPVKDPDLRPVPADKLEVNLLSGEAAALIRVGMSRAELVGKYFKLKPLLQDQLAESFRAKYQEIRGTEATPDDVFAALQRFAGGDVVRPPGVQNAVLAVLAYFFEECDIFERAASTIGAS